MSVKFEIEFIERESNINKNFGVYWGFVETPDYYVCSKNDKPYDRLFYVVNGTIVFNKGTKKEVKAEKGSLVFLPNDVTYKSEWPKTDNGKGEYISINFLSDEFYFKLPKYICIATADKNDYYLKMFRNILDIWLKGSVGYKLEVLSEIYKLLYNIFKDSFYSSTKATYETIYKGIVYLENNYLNEISVKDLAEICKTSESNFRRLFKKYKNMSPITYKNYLKINKACALLRTGEYTIAEAASSVNIEDYVYFHKLFKMFTGYTPKKYLETV